MRLEHHYATALAWTGDRGTGTSGYRAYGRDHVVTAPGKHPIEGSSDRTFHGDADRWNPEELLLAALSQCHLLSYLHVASSHGVVVTAYSDDATGTMEQTADGGGHFTSVTLRPRVTVSLTAPSDSTATSTAAPTSNPTADPTAARATIDADFVNALHAEAASKCFIAASVNFPVLHEPSVVVGA